MGLRTPGRMAKRWRNCRLNRLRTGLGRKRGVSDNAKEFHLGQLVELYWTLSPRLNGLPVCKSLKITALLLDVLVAELHLY